MGTTVKSQKRRSRFTFEARAKATMHVINLQTFREAVTEMAELLNRHLSDLLRYAYELGRRDDEHGIGQEARGVSKMMFNLRDRVPDEISLFRAKYRLPEDLTEECEI